MQMLYYRAEELDQLAQSCEINYLCNTRPKADLMTISSVEIYLDNEKWQKRPREDGYWQSSAEKGQALRVLRYKDFVWENGGEALRTMDSDFTKSLPDITTLKKAENS